MNFGKRKSELPQFQTTPMLDVVFLLLCFFVTSSVFSQWEYEVDIVLPTAESAKMPDRLPGEIIINVGLDGRISVNQQILTREQLQARLALLVQNFPGQPVVIRADKATAYEHVMSVVDTCRMSDIWNISFATDGGSGASPAK